MRPESNFLSITAAKLRLRVTQAPVAPAWSDFGLFLEPE